MNTIKRLRKNKKGFTLIEIIVVVVILAVLFAVAVPSVMKYINEADDAKYISQTRGAYIEMQAQIAKAVATDPEHDGLTVAEGADQISAALAKCTITGQPKPLKIGVPKAAITTTTMPTTYYTEFTGGKYGILKENEEVEITTKAPADGAVIWYTLPTTTE